MTSISASPQRPERARVSCPPTSAAKTASAFVVGGSVIAAFRVEIARDDAIAPTPRAPLIVADEDAAS